MEAVKVIPWNPGLLTCFYKTNALNEKMLNGAKGSVVTELNRNGKFWGEV